MFGSGSGRRTDGRTFALRTNSEEQEERTATAARQKKITHLDTDDDVQEKFVQSWLAKAESSELDEFFAEMAAKRSDYAKITRSVSIVGSRTSRSESPDAKSMSKALSETDRQRRSSRIGEVPLLQFSSSKYFCQEDDEYVQVTVLRLGSVDTKTSVKYKTKDGTAVAGVAYQHTEGVLTWEENEIDKEIKIPLHDDSEWAGVLEFRVILEEEGIENGLVSQTGGMTRIQRIDDDYFPSRKYEQEIRERKLDTIHPLGLLWEYVKVTFSDPVIKRGTIKMALLGQLKNLYFVMRLFANAYMVDHLLLPSESLETHQRVIGLFIWTAIVALPQALIHYLDYSRFTWKVVGTARMKLMSGLMNSFLYLDDAARAEVAPGDLMDSMTYDTDTIIKNGYMSCIAVCQVLGRIVMCLLFQVVAPLVEHSEPASELFSFRLFPVAVFPLSILVLLMVRMRTTYEGLKGRHKANADLVEGVHHTVGNFNLIADFGRRQWIMDQHEKNVMGYGARDKALAEIMCNNTHLMKWLTTGIVGAYVVLNGVDVISGEMKLGMFMTCLGVCQQMGALWNAIFQMLFTILMNAPAMDRVVTFVNMPCDCKQRMEWMRKAHDISHEFLNYEMRRIKTEKMANGSNSDLCNEASLELLPVSIKRLRVELHSRDITDPGRISTRSTFMDFDGFNISQGTLVSLVGHRGMGKSTLLRVLGGALLPDCKDEPERSDSEKAEFFVPTHLKVLHVAPDCMFIRGSLYDNLTLGVTKKHPNGDLSRVREICRRCGVSAKLVESIVDDKDAPHTKWSETLSGTEQHMLVLARAFIANPEVLCIHKPTLHLDDFAAAAVIDLCREFVDNRGVCLEKDERRIPRTCILTSARPTSVEKADDIFKVEASLSNHLSELPASLRREQTIVHINRDNIDQAMDLLQ